MKMLLFFIIVHGNNCKNKFDLHCRGPLKWRCDGRRFSAAVPWINYNDKTHAFAILKAFWSLSGPTPPAQFRGIFPGWIRWFPFPSRPSPKDAAWTRALELLSSLVLRVMQNAKWWLDRAMKGIRGLCRDGVFVTGIHVVLIVDSTWESVVWKAMLTCRSFILLLVPFSFFIYVRIKKQSSWGKGLPLKWYRKVRVLITFYNVTYPL